MGGNKIMKKLISMFMALSLVISLFSLPISVYAADSGTLSSNGKTYTSFSEALKLAENGSEITVSGEVAVPSDFQWQAHGKTLTIKGGTLNFSAISGEIYIRDNITFKDITLKFAEDKNVYAAGNKVTFGEGIVMPTAISLFGGSKADDLKETNLTLLSGIYKTIYGGSYGKKISGDSNLTVGGNVNSGIDETNHSGGNNVYGGSYNGNIDGTANLVFTGDAKAHYIRGGNHNGGTIAGGTNFIYSGGKSVGIYGGNHWSSEALNVNLKFIGGQTEQIFGGNDGTNLVGNVTVSVLGGTVTRRIYGGCYNDTEFSLDNFGFVFTTNNHVVGNIKVIIGDNANISFSSSREDRSIYGRSRSKEPLDDENSQIIFDGENAKTKYANKLGAQDSTMKSIMGSIEKADAIHFYTYSSNGDTLNATCSYCGSTHWATASLNLDNSKCYPKTSEEIKPASILYSENWDAPELEISYSNNIEVGEATATLSKNGAIVSKTFSIHNYSEKSDGEGHWLECDICKTITDKTPHTYKYNDEFHWTECACQVEKESHNFVNSVCECGKEFISTNVVTLSSKGVTQSNSSKLGFVSISQNVTAANSKANEVIGLSRYTNLANLGNTTRLGKFNGNEIKFQKTLSDAFFDNDIKTNTGDNQFGYPNYYSEHSLVEKDANGYYIPKDYTLDFTVDLGKGTDIAGMLISSTSGTWRFGDMEVYVSNDKDSLYIGTPVAKVKVADDLVLINPTSATTNAVLIGNYVDAFKVQDGQKLYGQYVGFRVINPFPLKKNTQVTAWQQTLRMTEIAVFGESHTHSYNAVTNAPTCTENGYTTYTCTCGEYYVGNEVATTAHNFDKLIDGQYTCSCGATTTTYAVKFYGYNDALIETVYVKAGEGIAEEKLAQIQALVSETAPIGYDFAKFNESIANIESDLDVYGEFAREKTEYAITFNDETLEKKYKFDSALTFTSKEALTWMIDGNVVGYGTTVTIYVAGDMDISTSEEAPTSSFIAIIGSATVNGKFIAIAKAYIQEGIEEYETGVEYFKDGKVVSAKSKYLNDIDFMTGLIGGVSGIQARAYIKIGEEYIYSANTVIF